MIDQEINIELFELFDMIKEESIFVEYKQLETKLLCNKELQNLLRRHEELNEEQCRIEYEPYQKELEDRKIEIENELLNYLEYQEYLKLYEKCNEYLNEIAKLIFKDIINVGENKCCGRK